MAAKPIASKKAAAKTAAPKEQAAANKAAPKKAKAAGKKAAVAKLGGAGVVRTSKPMAPEPVVGRPVDVSSVVGVGGESHQVVAAGGVRLTTQQGIPVADDQNSLRVGGRGPTLLDDFHFREKIFHFDHERIPERVVHARGFGVKGFFEPYAAAAGLSRADVFQRPGERTEVFVRFSTVAGNKGSFDLARDVRGFAVKFYTREGNWDLVGNNIPVFFIQDAIKFPDVVHAVKQEPDRGFPQAQSAHDNFWDFISLMPEATHMVMWTMSDRALPRSYRFMEGFGVHSFRLIDAEGVSRYVKFHWKPAQGLQSVLWNEAVKINGADPDFHRRDLWDAISTGDYPEWELGVQVFDDAFADAFEFDVLDATKIIPEELVAVTPIGRMVLDRTVDNFFAETEQVAFCTQNVVPGIDFTNDPLLQGRNFSYLDTQLKRLGGPNFTHIPVNAPHSPVANFQQDGHMAMTNPIGRVNYEPNSFAGADRGPREDPTGGYTSFPAVNQGVNARVRSATFADHFSQARQFLISQTAIEQQHIVNGFVFELSKVDNVDIRTRMVANLRNVDDAFARAIADGLGLAELPIATTPASPPITDLPPSGALSIINNGPATFAGRKIGALITDGTDVTILTALQTATDAEGAVLELIAPKIGGVTLTDGTHVPADQNIDGGPSVLYDAIAILTSHDGATALTTSAAAKDFLTDAHNHCKYIAHVTTAAPLLHAAGLTTTTDNGYHPLDHTNTTAFITTCRHLRHWEREPTIDGS